VNRRVGGSKFGSRFELREAANGSDQGGEKEGKLVGSDPYLGGLWRVALCSTLWKLFWYAALASAAWLGFYVAFRAALRHRRVGRDTAPTARQVWREVGHSLRSLAVFGLATLAVYAAARADCTRLYYRIDERGWAYLVLSVGLMVVLHDTWFYWTHRLMHHRWLFRFVHRTHHRSTNPTPWAAYAFSVPEALVQAGIGPLITFAMPTHPLAFAAFMVCQTAFNVLGHCGYEIFPSWFLRSPAGYLLNSVTHHALHHEKFRANFGLYFNVWDRLLGTNHPDYERRFARASGRRRPVGSHGTDN
jgi:sterol desaturase/sphingolipid hydroxylase (fatty acid hydroxylase superfamily)